MLEILNEENNCKTKHNRSKLIDRWLVKDKYVVKIFFIKNNEIRAAPHIF
jgi:hypothetical protein